MASVQQDELRRQIKRLRRERGWTQHELARRTHLHPSRISHMEGGHECIWPGYVRRFARAFGVSVDELQEPQQVAAVGGR